MGVATGVKDKRVKDSTVVHVPPEESPQSTGGAGSAHGRIMGGIRTARADLEKKFGEKVGPRYKLMPWLVRHVPWCRSRFQQGRDGRSSHQRLYGKPYTSATLMFGEVCVGRLRAKVATAARLDARGLKGIWVGKSDENDEHILLTERGVVLARTVTRKPGGEKFDREFLKVVFGLSWNPRGKGIDEEPKPQQKEPVAPGKVRRLYITEALLDKYGRTPDCTACEWYVGPHNEVCRARIEREHKVEEEREERKKISAPAEAARAHPDEKDPGYFVGHKRVGEPEKQRAVRAKGIAMTPGAEVGEGQDEDVSMEVAEGGEYKPGRGQKRRRHADLCPPAG